MGDFAGFLNALRLAGEGSPRSHPRSAYLKALPFTVQRVVVPSARGRHRVRREAMPEGIEVAMIFFVPRCGFWGPCAPERCDHPSAFSRNAAPREDER
jgi:hypothetical protein